MSNSEALVAWAHYRPAMQPPDGFGSPTWTRTGRLRRIIVRLARRTFAKGNARDGHPQAAIELRQDLRAALLLSLPLDPGPDRRCALPHGDAARTGARAGGSGPR